MGSIKLTMLVCVMVVAMAGFASKVQANYHVSDVIYEGRSGVLKACPSNYYNCKCYGRAGDRAGIVSPRTPPLPNFFSIANMCGYKKLDHYHNNDGTYSVFVAGGNGKVVATCHGADNNKATLSCPLGGPVGKVLHDVVYDHLICYGQPCQPDR